MRTAKDMTPEEWSEYSQMLCQTLDPCMAQDSDYMLLLFRTMPDRAERMHIMASETQRKPEHLRLVARGLIDMADRLELDNVTGKEAKREG